MFYIYLQVADLLIANLPCPSARVTFSTSEVYMRKVRNSKRHEIFKLLVSRPMCPIALLIVSFPNLIVETHTVMSWVVLYKYRTSKCYRNVCL